MNITVIGAGKMGLPLACYLAARGAKVWATDVRRTVVDAINSARSPIDEPGVQKLLEEVVPAGRLRATFDTGDAVRRSEVAIVIVPALLTPDRHADLSILDAVTAEVAGALHEGLLVSYETTVPVGTTRQRFLPRLEQGSWRVGKNFYVAFSPERVKSGLVLERMGKTPKVVGGAEPESARRAEEFYRTALGVEVVNVGSLENAEMVKLAGMIYRDVNIALANELARYAEAVGIDFSRLLAAANNDGEAHLLEPGFGVGGHCAPVYPYFVIHHARAIGVPVTCAENARAINDGQAVHVVTRLEKALGSLEGRETLILGLGFRPQVKEHFCSPAFLLQTELQRRGASVKLHDDLYTPDELWAFGFRAGGLNGDRVADIIILNTAHAAYKDLDFAALAARGLKAVVDGRNLWEPQEVRRHGLIYLGIGRP